MYCGFELIIIAKMAAHSYVCMLWMHAGSVNLFPSAEPSSCSDFPTTVLGFRVPSLLAGF
jgi:hypothetical protein